MADGELTHGLQEWQVCCDALSAGETVILLRKGGIHERGGGTFVAEHPCFALMPTRLHQAAERLREPYGSRIEAGAEPGDIPIAAWAAVQEAWRVTDLSRILDLGRELLWTEAEVERRFAYRDQPWLSVLLLRVYRYPVVQSLADDPAYAGCRSWIALKQVLPAPTQQPALADQAFASRASMVESILIA